MLPKPHRVALQTLLKLTRTGTVDATGLEKASRIPQPDLDVIIKDLEELKFITGLRGIGSGWMALSVTARGRTWLHENGTSARLKRWSRWAGSSAAASAATFGFRSAFAEAAPALSAVGAITLGTIVGVFVALGASTAE